MGTEFEITAVHSSIDSCKRGMYYAFREVERIEKMTSNYKDTTEISYVNRNAFKSPVKVTPELFRLLARSMAYSQKYDGYFDITVGPLTDYWGFNSDHPIETEPDSKRIKELLAFVNYKYVVLNPDDTSVSFTKEGVSIDLGGIAKGYGLDRAAMMLRKLGITDFLINGGGDIYASGRKSKNEKWIVGIKNPRDNEKLLAKLEAENIAVCTSGDYERFRIINGVRYHHIFDPKTGYPASVSQSATVIMDNCEEGVMLSKYVFILGDESKKLDSAIPFFRVDKDGKTIYNDILKNYNLYLVGLE